MDLGYTLLQKTATYQYLTPYVRYGFQVVSFLFQGLLLAGTLFFWLVVKAHVPAVGWTAFGITSVCLVVCSVFWWIQFWTERKKQRCKLGGRSSSG